MRDLCFVYENGFGRFFLILEKEVGEDFGCSIVVVVITIAIVAIIIAILAYVDVGGD